MASGDGYELPAGLGRPRAHRQDDLGTWEGLVDAATGELLAFEDTNQYAARRVVGGVYPFSNDQRPPDGIEQAGWPMPFLNVTVGGSPFTTTTGGTLALRHRARRRPRSPARSPASTTPAAPISETLGDGDLDLGSASGGHRLRRSRPATPPATPRPRAPRSTS